MIYDLILIFYHFLKKGDLDLIFYQVFDDDLDLIFYHFLNDLSNVWGMLWECYGNALGMPVHLLSEDVSSREDASTSWPSSSGLRGRRKTLLPLKKRQK
jgi:hypothetical protein